MHAMAGRAAEARAEEDSAMMEDPMCLLPEEDKMSDELIERGTEAVFQLGLRLNREEARAVFVAALAAIETSGTHRVVPTNAWPEMLGAWYRHKNGFVFAGDPPATDTSDAGAYRAMLSAAPKLGGET